ncbi:MAG: phosphoribosyltransferase-like protein [Neobacillus sp.]
MHLLIEPSKDDVNLKKIIKLLCTTQIRQPMKFEQIKAWLNQFDKGSETTLALLILRFLIYRTSDQLVSSLKQALKCAVKNFIHQEQLLETYDWREILNGTVDELDFYFGPIKHANTTPGKSGEIISRLLKSSISTHSSSFDFYPDQITILKPKERYLLVDDGIYTGHQLSNFIGQNELFNRFCSQTGILVALAHESGIIHLQKNHPNISVFYGEKITSKSCFEAISEEWIEDKIWPYSDITPLDQYLEIVKNKAKFTVEKPLGYGNLGCLIAYDHGIPDDSLQLLWDKSESWNPLIAR